MNTRTPQHTRAQAHDRHRPQGAQRRITRAQVIAAVGLAYMTAVTAASLAAASATYNLTIYAGGTAADEHSSVRVM